MALICSSTLNHDLARVAEPGNVLRQRLSLGVFLLKLEDDGEVVGDLVGVYDDSLNVARRARHGSNECGVGDQLRLDVAEQVCCIRKVMLKTTESLHRLHRRKG